MPLTDLISLNKTLFKDSYIEDTLANNIANQIF